MLVRHSRPVARWIWALWAASALFIVYGTTIPFHLVADRATVAAKLSRLTLNPLISPDTGRRVSLPDVAQNMLLFVPFGLFGAMALPRRQSRFRQIALIALLAVLLSIAVETAQLFIVDRWTSLTDVLSDTLGATVAAALSPHIVGRFSGATTRLNGRGALEASAFSPMVVALTVCVLATWEPYDFTLDPGTVVHQLRLFWHDPRQFAGPAYPAFDVLRWSVAAFVTALWLTEIGARAPVILAGAGCVGAATLAQIGQFFVESGMRAFPNYALTVAGAIVGSLALRMVPRAPSRVASTTAIVVATGVAVALGDLAPVATASWKGFQAAGRVFELALVCFPVGFAVAMAIDETWRAFAIAAALVFVIAVPPELARPLSTHLTSAFLLLGVALTGCVLGHLTARVTR